MSHWGLYNIRVNHFLKSTLNEDEATRRYPQHSEHYTARAHRGITPRFPTLSEDRPWTCPGGEIIFPTAVPDPQYILPIRL